MVPILSPVLLTPDEMGEVDRSMVEQGTPIVDLMRRAGEGVARHVPAAGRVAILAGPGNNGGDGFATGVLLRKAGRDVDVFALGGNLTSEATQTMKAEWGECRLLEGFDPTGFEIVVDGLFGAGLSRDIDGAARRAIERANESRSFKLAIDIASGIDGATGQVHGVAVRADRTVTFERRKPGHLLLPGRIHCGEVIVEAIGIPSDLLDERHSATFANEPALWLDALPPLMDTHHKYDRGHVGVFSGGATQTGAGRLAAMAALRGGAGLVTVLARSSALMVNAAHLTAIMLKRCETGDDLAALLGDARMSTFILGPGYGVGERAREISLAILAAGRSLVLDADGITSFADRPDALFEQLRERDGRGVLTPHAGEFGRLFPDLLELIGTDRLTAARNAAQRSGATIVLKGADTVIASPDGRAAINATGTAALATAGSGDVLAGLIAAQLATGVPPFEAASVATWIHGRAGAAFGVGLIAEDLPHLVPQVLADLALQAAARNQR